MIYCTKLLEKALEERQRKMLQEKNHLDFAINQNHLQLIDKYKIKYKEEKKAYYDLLNSYNKLKNNMNRS